MVPEQRKNCLFVFFHSLFGLFCCHNQEMNVAEKRIIQCNCQISLYNHNHKSQVGFYPCLSHFFLQIFSTPSISSSQLITFFIFHWKNRCHQTRTYCHHQFHQLSCSCTRVLCFPSFFNGETSCFFLRPPLVYFLLWISFHLTFSGICFLQLCSALLIYIHLLICMEFW